MFGWGKKPVANTYTEQEIADYEPRKWRLYDFYKEQFEHQIKAATYLMTAHGACLIGCFTAFKETSEPFKGLGFLVSCFVWGFFLAVLGFVFEVQARSTMLASIMASGPRAKLPSFIDSLAKVLQTISLMILILCLAGIAARLAKL